MLIRVASNLLNTYYANILADSSERIAFLQLNQTENIGLIAVISVTQNVSLESLLCFIEAYPVYIAQLHYENKGMHMRGCSSESI